jgi:hypothetical protein
MPDVLVYERATSFADSLARRGHHIVYRANTSNQCPGCGRSQWYVGRISAECGYCATAVPLAEARLDRPSPAVYRREDSALTPVYDRVFPGCPRMAESSQSAMAASHGKLPYVQLAGLRPISTHR